jgi:hypothetical protein
LMVGTDAKAQEVAKNVPVYGRQETWKMIYNKQAGLCPYKNPSDILPGSGGRFSPARGLPVGARIAYDAVSCLLEPSG